jgi:hypothetical protein
MTAVDDEWLYRGLLDESDRLEHFRLKREDAAVPSSQCKEQFTFAYFKV